MTLSLLPIEIVGQVFDNVKSEKDIESLASACKLLFHIYEERKHEIWKLKSLSFGYLTVVEFKQICQQPTTEDSTKYDFYVTFKNNYIKEMYWKKTINATRIRPAIEIIPPNPTTVTTSDGDDRNEHNNYISRSGNDLKRNSCEMAFELIKQGIEEANLNINHSKKAKLEPNQELIHKSSNNISKKITTQHNLDIQGTTQAYSRSITPPPNLFNLSLIQKQCMCQPTKRNIKQQQHQHHVTSNGLPPYNHHSKISVHVLSSDMFQQGVEVWGRLLEG